MTIRLLAVLLLHGRGASNATADERKRHEKFNETIGVKRRQCAVQRLCWICGQPLFDVLAFIGGPKSAEHRIFADAAMHVECAVYTVQVCPFIADPNYQRRAFEHLGTAHPGQDSAKPDRSCVFVTNDYKIAKTTGGWLFHPAPAKEIQWWKDGKRIE